MSGIDTVPSTGMQIYGAAAGLDVANAIAFPNDAGA